MVVNLKRVVSFWDVRFVLRNASFVFFLIFVADSGLTSVCLAKPFSLGQGAKVSSTFPHQGCVFDAFLLLCGQ